MYPVEKYLCIITVHHLTVQVWSRCQQEYDNFNNNLSRVRHSLGGNLQNTVDKTRRTSSYTTKHTKKSRVQIRFQASLDLFSCKLSPGQSNNHTGLCPYFGEICRLQFSRKLKKLQHPENCSKQKIWLQTADSTETSLYSHWSLCEKPKWLLQRGGTGRDGLVLTARDCQQWPWTHHRPFI